MAIKHTHNTSLVLDIVLNSTQLTGESTHQTSVKFKYIIFAVHELSLLTDLTSHVLNVTLECGCVLSRILDLRDEVIGYKSPVLEDNILPGGHVRELGLSVSRADFPCHVCVYTNRWGGNLVSEVPVVVVSCSSGEGCVPVGPLCRNPFAPETTLSEASKDSKKKKDGTL